MFEGLVCFQYAAVVGVFISFLYLLLLMSVFFNLLFFLHLYIFSLQCNELKKMQIQKLQVLYQSTIALQLSVRKRIRNCERPHVCECQL